MQVETEKQQNLERDLLELRAKYKMVEDQLKQQQKITKTLLPTIAASRQNFAKNRLISTQMATKCNEIGRIVKGETYK